MASQKQFWAVKNLCRRGVVAAEEFGKKHNEKDVFQWLACFGERKLEEELRYWLQVQDNNGTF